MATELIRDSADYKNLVRLIDTLRNQQQKAREDIKLLDEGKTNALKDPGVFVEQLVDRVRVMFDSLETLTKFPLRQTVPSLPVIDFGQYSTAPVPAQITEGNPSEVSTVSSAVSSPLSSPVTVETKAEVKSEVEEPKAGKKIRGRVFTPEKPTSFNTLWSDEEQTRLEKLLEVFPDEPVAAHRWKKIAQALGNRTPKQVASRTQKYFIRLAKEGKKVPGRLPNLEHYKSKKKRKGSKGDERAAKRRETDTSYYAPPPVYMSDEEEFGDHEDIHPELKETEEYKELLSLLKLKQEQERLRKERVVDQSDVMEHLGYKCSMDPIIGLRWRCRDCPKEAEIDLCSDCAEIPFETSTHLKEHQLEQIDRVETVPYYLNYNHQLSAQEEPNYLDSSFMST